MGPVSTRGLFGLLATSSEHMLGQPETAFYELKHTCRGSPRTQGCDSVRDPASKE